MSKHAVSRTSKALLLGLILGCAVHLATASTPLKKESNGRAGQTAKPDFGRLEVSGGPGNYPILIDDKPAGETNANIPHLVDLAPGQHTVRIILPNGRQWTRVINVVAGRRQCVKINYHPQPACELVLTGSPDAREGELITFTAEVRNATRALAYNWSVSPAPARIVSGAQTATITVDTTGLGPQKVTAVLQINDDSTDPRCECRQVARSETSIAVTPLPKVTSRRFDLFPSVSFDDDKARLDNLAIEMQRDPTATAYIFVYSGRGSRAGEAERLGARARQYLVNSRGLSANRVVVKNAGRSEANTFELVIVPRGAPLPQPGEARN